MVGFMVLSITNVKPSKFSWKFSNQPYLRLFKFNQNRPCQENTNR